MELVKRSTPNRMQ